MSGSISTIEDILPRLQEIANGEKTVFSADFSFISSEFVLVYLGEEKQTSGYTVDVTANTVTFATPPATNTIVTIVRAVPLNWEVSDSGNNRGAMDKDAFDRVFSLLVGKMQTLKEELSRCVKTPISSDKNGEQVSEFFLTQLADALTVLSQAQDVLALIQSTSSSALASINSALETALSQIQVQVQRASDFADSAEASANLAQTTVNNALGDIEDALNEALARLDLSLCYTKEEANGTFVALQGNQTITGIKTFNAAPRFKSNLSPSTSSSKESIIEDLLIQASTNTEGKVDGMFVSRVQDTGGNREVQYRGGFYAPNAETNRWPAIALGVTSGERTYSNLKVDLAIAPHPAASTNYSNQAIMTVGRAADPVQNFNLLHRSGDEIFSGIKTGQSNNPRFGFKHTEIDVTTNPPEQKSMHIFFSDKRNKWISEIGIYQETNGTISTQITANNDTSGVAALRIVCEKNGAKYGTCPTPGASDNSTKISNTQWVNSRITSIMNNKLQVVSSLPSSPNADTFYFIPED